MTQAAMRMLAMSKAMAFPSPQGNVHPMKNMAMWIAAVKSEATLGGFVQGWGNPDGTCAHGSPAAEDAGSALLAKALSAER